MQRKIQCHSVLGDVFVGSTLGGRAGRTGGMFPGESLCPATLGMFPRSSERRFFPRMASTPWEILRVIHALHWNLNDFEKITPFCFSVCLLNTSKRMSLLGSLGLQHLANTCQSPSDKGSRPQAYTLQQARTSHHCFLSSLFIFAISFYLWPGKLGFPLAILI